MLVIIFVLSGCGLFASSEDPTGPQAIRTAQPTFTPTVAAAQAPVQTAIPDSSASNGGNAAPSTGGSSVPDSGAKAVINAPLVNARAGPSTDDEIIGTIERGAEYAIVGVSPDRAWWKICCIDDAQAWVTSEFVDTLGMVDSVPVVGGEVGGVAEVEAEAEATEPPAATEAAVAAAPTAAPTATSAPAATFILESQEQFAETSTVRIFLYVYAGNSALEDYALRVTKDGAELPVEGSSFGGQPAFTWPFQDPRQRFQNFKVEYPDTPPQGEWELQLVDKSGATVGPPATFTLSNNDPEQELYVRYAQR